MEISQESPPFVAVASTAQVSASPEFEFWMLGKNPQPSSLLTADELFFDGVLLPLHLLSIPPPPPTTTSSSSASSAPASAAPTPPPVNRLKKWSDHIPRAGSRKKTAAEDGSKEQRRLPKERRGSAGGPAELNINIWPFSRSRSAGNAAAAGWWSARARAAVAARKVSSAPCSRSNSRGESSAKPATAASSSSRRWVPSASRVAAFAGGIHLGRTTPVWKIHKKVTVQRAEDPSDRGSAAPGAKKATAGSTQAGGARVLNFHVNTCIGYRSRESCSGGGLPMVSGGGVVGGSGGGGGGSIFKLRTIFSKNNNVY